MLREFQNYLATINTTSEFVDEERTMLHFNIDGINYLFVYNANSDPAYIRILIPYAGTVDVGNQNDLLMLHNLTVRFKIGKAYADNGQVWFATEAFVYTKDCVYQVFQRMISVLRDMLIHYRAITNERETTTNQ